MGAQFHNLLYSCVYEKERSNEQFVQEHALGMVLSGELHLHRNRGPVLLEKGSIGLIRRNQLVRAIKVPEPSGAPFKAINILLDQHSLKQYASTHTLGHQDHYHGETIHQFTGNVFLKGYFESLMPYFDHPNMLTGAISEIKTMEAIALLLKARPELIHFLFDFNDPHKIDLEAFMNQNFTFNVPHETFAQLTGRSLATFKRDFKKTFDASPGQWLTRKRLEQAYYLLDQKSKKPSDIYLDLGFENFSHFSHAFKKQYGVSPTKI